MHGHRFRQVVNAPTRLVQPVAEVQVLAVHEEVGVERAGLIQGRPPDHETGGRAGVDLVFPRGVEMAQVVAVEAGAAPEEPAQA